MKNGLKIFVPYNGSSEASNALDEALDTAKAFNGSITLLHARAYYRAWSAGSEPSIPTSVF